MSQPFRLETGLIDHSKPLAFSFNGRTMQGFHGDTLASALLANGQRLVGRSFKYHRPRGIFSAGSEEPNALVTLGKGAHAEPNTRATVVELTEGLEAFSQNHRGSLERDLMAVNDLLAPFLSAGFYYKTFMWPRGFWEKLYEPAIRASAGLGRLSGLPDPDSYDHGHLHCDILVVGAGPAGLSAALAAGRTGARVILADEDFRMGGRLLAENMTIGDTPAHAWAGRVAAELASLPNVRLLPRTTVFGTYDGGVHGALEQCGLATRGPRAVLWHVRALRTILAAGATERSIAFPGNDRPGVMLAGAVRAYLNRFGVAPGRRVAVFTNNDDGWATARDLIRQSVEIAAVIDTRVGVSHDLGDTPVLTGDAVAATRGRRGLTGLTTLSGRKIEADCLAVAGGWNPNLHLTCHLGARPRWDKGIAAFVPADVLPRGQSLAGAAGGRMTLAAALADGRRAAADALSGLGFDVPAEEAYEARDEPREITAFWQVEASGRAFVDLQNDVTTKDIFQAKAEGFQSVEHLKRYTTLGMATDQGRTSGVLGLAILAGATNRSIPETGTTVFRPPYTPVPIGALAGRARGKRFRPTRLTPSHAWAEANGATFVTAGPWLRAQWYARPGEQGWRDSVDREVTAVRTGAGVCDVSTLGKIEIQGRDTAAFLDKVYANGFSTLAEGRVRYGLMLREDGIAYDDGTTARLGPDHYLMTTTTANAALVLRNLEFARQCLWPDFDVHLAPVTDQWAQFSVAGPKSRSLLEKVVDTDLSNEAFPFMACASCTVLGTTPGRIFRISFSGELAYEIAVPARYGASMMEALTGLGATPYGTEALGVMRIEKGHFAGNEMTGQTTAQMLGVGRMVSTKKDAIGAPLSRREELSREDGLAYVGFRPVDRGQQLSAGAHFLAPGAPADTAHDEGWMTSVAYSPELGYSVGLGFLRRGGERMGERLRAWDGLRGSEVLVEVCPPQHVDPHGERQRG